MGELFHGMRTQTVHVVQAAHLLGDVKPAMALGYHVLLHSLNRPAARPAADAFPAAVDDHVEEPNHVLKINCQ